MSASKPVGPVGRAPTAPATRAAVWPLVVLFCLLWSAAFAVAKVGIADCPPLILLGTRFILAGAMMLGLAFMTGGFKGMRTRDFAVLAGLGLVNNALYLGLTWCGMATLSSGYTAVVVSAAPLLTAVLAAPLLGERLTWAKLGGLLLGMVGVAMVVRSRLGGGGEDPVGTLLVVGGLVSIAVGTVLFKRLDPRGSLWAINAVQSLSAGFATLPVGLAIEDVSAIRFTPALGLSFAALVVGASIAAYWLWFYLLRRVSATGASSLHFLMPPLGLLFGWLLLGEPVAAADLIGIVPIAVGIGLVTRAPSAPRAGH
ncbi:DMT family transporter [Rhizobiales bacterium Sp-1]|uniref:DMT family transporter n=2 Tax=Segnochrobactrum spirostomi TaxID=2608987 RepID=A0A6A7Y091_9HYPH|nr:DMT family transporter [Segnochrobactrum spirostomi]